MVEPIFRQTPTDSPLTAEIIQRASEEQQAKALKMGEIMGGGGAAPWHALAGAEEQFLGGRALARKEAAQDLASKQLSGQITAQDIQNQRNQGNFSEEQQKRAMLDAPVAGDAGGKTMRQRMAEAELGTSESQAKHEQVNADQARELNNQQIAASRAAEAQARASTAGLYKNIKNEQDRIDAEMLQTKLVGIYNNFETSSQAQDDTAKRLTADFAKHHPDLGPQFVQGIFNSTRTAALQNLSQVRNAGDLLVAQSPEYQVGALPAINDTNQKLAKLQQLDALIGNYRQNVVAKTGKDGFAIDSDLSKTFLNNFAQLANNFDPTNPSQAGSAAVGGVGLDTKSALQKMNDLRDALYNQVRTGWQGTSQGFSPRIKARPEVAGIDSRLQAQGIPGVGNTAKRAIGAVQGSQPPAGATASIFSRPGPAGNVTAAPVFGTPSAAQPDQSGMPPGMLPINRPNLQGSP